MRKERGGRRLIYVSRSLMPRENAVDHAQTVTGIVKSARVSNAALGVTGILLLHGTHFGQVLEGKVKALRKVMGRIRRDKRHAEITILRDEPLHGQRVFGDWSMGLVTASSTQAHRVRLRDDGDAADAAVDLAQQNDLIAEVRQMVIAAANRA